MNAEIIEKLKIKFADDAKKIRKVLNASERMNFSSISSSKKIYDEYHREFESELIELIDKVRADEQNKHGRQITLFDELVACNKTSTKLQKIAKKQYQRMLKNKMQAYSNSSITCGLSKPSETDCYY